MLQYTYQWIGRKQTFEHLTFNLLYCRFANIVSHSLLPLQLKKETMDSKEKWTAGCTTNCSSETPCKTSTQPPCHLECCNATMISCLWLNGTMQVPNFSSRGPHHHIELISSLLCMLAITLFMWVNKWEKPGQLPCGSLGNQRCV